MSHFGKTFCMLLAILVLLGACLVWHRLPVPDTGMLQRMEESWSGVLRIWVCEGWACGSGSLSAWLNAAGAQFEKRHRGVYVHFSQISVETLAAFNYAAENPPDMLIFAPGMLDAPEDLLALPASEDLRAELCGYGGGYACPIAMGGYAWARNRALSPDSSLFLLPEDAPYLCYSAALAALLLEKTVPEGQEAPSDGRYGVDLGLPSPTARAAETLPPARREIIPSPESGRASDAYTRFARREVFAAAVTQREIRRLQLLDEGGRGPDWEIVPGDVAFTDQLALAAVVDIPREDLRDRQALCLSLLELLLSDAQQRALAAARALRVTDGAALYAGQRGMAALEEFYMQETLLVPPAFGKRWRTAAAQEADLLLSRNGGAEDALDRLFP